MKEMQNPNEAQDAFEDTKMTLTVPAESVGARLDIFAAAEAGITRSAAVKLISDGYIKVNGKTSNKNYKLRAGETVEIDFPAPESDEAYPQDIPLDIIYEDDDIIVINKERGMVVHPAAGNPDGTLVNALLFHCKDSLSGIGGVMRPGIVHRIDKDTSGLIAVAKNDHAHLFLSEQLKTHEMHRIYRAIAVGGFREDSGTVNANIGRHPNDRKKMAVIRDEIHTSREAVTHWRVLERYAGFTYIECQLETGRTHQIRVHMSHIGHPLLADSVYGGGHTPFEKANAHVLDGQCLHAARLVLRHPRTNEIMEFEAPLPADFEKILGKLRQING